ncbi:MAG TPA: TspO/MBR family protein [Thermomicrobiaceae bacterium]|nr:TspO/MBR family protein [Thermomicrobiaceae bacterium]
MAAFLVGRRGMGERDTRRALGLFGIQLTLNGLWSPAFFGLRSPKAGLAVIIALWLALAATIAAFARVSRPAALLMLPYLAWSSFAAALNGAIWRLNR